MQKLGSSFVAVGLAALLVGSSTNARSQSVQAYTFYGSMFGTTYATYSSGGYLDNVGYEGMATVMQAQDTVSATAEARYASELSPPMDPTTEQIGAGTEWMDGITVTSTTLPTGTPVTINFILKVNATASYEDNFVSEQQSTAHEGAGVIVTDNTSMAQIDVSYSPTTNQTNGTDIHTVVEAFNVEIGDTLAFSGAASASSSATYTSPTDTAVSDATITDLFYADPGENFTLVSLSGHNYESPVPAPASWPVLVVGLLGLSNLARRRRSPSNGTLRLAA